MYAHLVHIFFCFFLCAQILDVLDIVFPIIFSVEIVVKVTVRRLL